jgi:hypothetical protein
MNENVYALPLKKFEFVKSLEKIVEPSIAVIFPRLTKNMPVQYSQLRKKRKLEEIQYLTEYENVSLKNPFKSVAVDLLTQIITLEFEFEQSDFNSLGFDTVPEITFNLNCIWPCRKVVLI